MLVIYTPTDQTRDTIDLIIKTVGNKRWNSKNCALLFQKDTDFSVSFTASWCRELTLGILLNWLANVPPGKLDIYGIRKHGRHCSNQPRGITGCIEKRDTLIDALFINVFQFMVGMLDQIFETNVMSQHTLGFWADRAVSRYTEWTKGDQLIKCLLNLGTGMIPDTPLWKDEMYGTITGIPSEWALRPAVMSYLFYIVRLWGAFYENGKTLKGMTKLTRLKYNDEFLLRLVGATTTQPRARAKVVGLGIWRSLASKLMLPLWFTESGKTGFWVFTYLLIQEGLAVNGGAKRIPGFKDALAYTNCSGFRSWLRYYISVRDLAPRFVFDLNKYLEEHGPFGLLHTRTAVPYV